MLHLAQPQEPENLFSLVVSKLQPKLDKLLTLYHCHSTFVQWNQTQSVAINYYCVKPDFLLPFLLFILMAAASTLVSVWRRLAVSGQNLIKDKTILNNTKCSKYGSIRVFLICAFQKNQNSSKQGTSNTKTRKSFEKNCHIVAVTDYGHPMKA